jgi:osmotically-inducible protein OsmY
MKPILLRAAGVIACGAVSIATAQTSAAPSPSVSYVDEPIASAMKPDGPDADKVNAIVQALNADASLKNSKITVQTDNDVVLLTGAAATQEQVQHATDVARSSADNAKIVNVVQPDHTIYKMPA